MNRDGKITNLLAVMSASPILAEFPDTGKWLSRLGIETTLQFDRGVDCCDVVVAPSQRRFNCEMVGSLKTVGSTWCALADRKFLVSTLRLHLKQKICSWLLHEFSNWVFQNLYEVREFLNLLYFLWWDNLRLNPVAGSSRLIFATVLGLWYSTLTYSDSCSSSQFWCVGIIAKGMKG